VSENKKFLDIFRVKNMINALIGFIETKVEIYKIQFKEEMAKALSVLVLLTIFSMIGTLFILFISHFLSQLLNDVLGNDYAGYLIISGLYLVIGIIVYLFRKKIKDSIIDMMFADEDTENEEDYGQ
jgi:uncharacterized membrane protein YqjE